MALPKAKRRSSIRISLGDWIEHKDLDVIVERFQAGLEQALCS